MQEPIEGSARELTGDDRALAIVQPQRELINVEQAVEEWNRYQDLTRRLLSDSDYQKIGNRSFKKKSAWRKYAKAFNISCAVVSEQIERAEDGFPLFARAIVRATEPGGRWQESDQECHVKERCCAAATKGHCFKAQWSTHTCCKPDCNGRLHFSHPGDLPATAITRAKNRAISDLIGAGEVSAEEMDDEPTDAKPAAKPAKKGNPTQQQDGAGEARHALKTALAVKFVGDEQAQHKFMTEVEPSACGETTVDYSAISAERCQEIIAIVEQPA